MKSEQNLTDFSGRIQNLRAISGQSQGQIAAWLEVSRTTLHHYCTGRNAPKAAAWFRLEQAEKQWAAGIGSEAGKGSGREESALREDHPLPEEPAFPPAERPRAEVELTRHLRWLQAAKLRQQEAVRAAQRHLVEIEGWLQAAEAEWNRVRAVASSGVGPTLRCAEAGGDVEDAKPTPLRDIDTVSLPIFGALPAGWPQTREGVLAQWPTRKVAVPRGRFPEGAFGLEVRGDSMNAARPQPIFDRDIVVLISPEQREPQHDDIVAALIDGDTCLKRLKVRRKKGAFLRSESTNPVHGEIYPTHDLVIQGVLVGKL